MFKKSLRLFYFPFPFLAQGWEGEELVGSFHFCSDLVFIHNVPSRDLLCECARHIKKKTPIK